MIKLTDKAVNQIKKLQVEMEQEGTPLRMAVLGGGCSGHQYSLGFDKEREGDTKFDATGVTVLIDNHSLPLLEGIELDFVEGMQGSSFIFNNPNATGGCGCGKSFSC